MKIIYIISLMYTIHVELGVCKIMVFEMAHAHQCIYFMKKYSNLFDQIYSKNTL